MVKFEGVQWKGFVLMTEDSFEHLLNCLDNQRSVSGGEAQEAIDDYGRQCRRCLHEGIDIDKTIDDPQ